MHEIEIEKIFNEARDRGGEYKQWLKEFFEWAEENNMLVWALESREKEWERNCILKRRVLVTSRSEILARKEQILKQKEAEEQERRKRNERHSLAYKWQTSFVTGSELADALDEGINYKK